MELPTPTVTTHFPHALVPDQFLHGSSQEAAGDFYEEEDDGLGYYSDGTKRTLTDEQIAMFRHSEIQAILRKRRLLRECGHVSEEGETISEAPRAVHQPAPAPSSVAVAKDRQTRATQLPKQQWATSSERTKARNRRNRDRYKIKKREIRERTERAQNDGPRLRDEDEESDEWDPWHQSNGPDAQKDDALDLDY
ncbi:hypothetical protein DE146DRAFT_629205 [Phaeosphaeria sp. MPI-PUGE-AT-0046c]|nr:hypothetical protein DE146DRAFT_629205 [Phaeosphaeria sp. MPI-PUGE-AT-0046c]